MNSPNELAPRPNGQVSAAQHKWAPVILALIVLLIACAAWIVHQNPGEGKEIKANLQHQWIAVACVLIAFCALSGYLINGRLDGILIDDRNRMSLSRLQWVAWLVVLLGGYFTEAVWNMTNATGFPDMEQDLWWLLGIVSGSAVASNMIVDYKKAGGQSADQVPPQSGQPDQTGSIDRNVTVMEASWADLFLGEEVANRNVVDISRLQQLVITVLLVVTYVKLLWDALGKATAAVMDMPLVTGNAVLPNGSGHGFLWLLSLSHAAYLTYKATPKSGPGANPSDAIATNLIAPTSPVPPTSPAPLTTVPVRVAISDVGSVQGLQLLVDGRPVAVPATGFVEVSLETGSAHTLTASGTRNAQAVTGQLTVTPNANDLNKAYEITL